MALTNIATPKSEYTYIPKSQRGDKNPFSVTFKRLDITTASTIQDMSLNIQNDGSYTINANIQNLEALKHALTGWNNIFDDKGKQVKFRIVRNLADLECLEFIPHDLRTEIANIIFEVSKDIQNADDILTGD